MLILHIKMRVHSCRSRLLARLNLWLELCPLLHGHSDEILVIWLYLNIRLLSINYGFIFSVIWPHIERHELIDLIYLILGSQWPNFAVNLLDHYCLFNTLLNLQSYCTSN